MNFSIEQKGCSSIRIGGVKSLLDFTAEEVAVSIKNGIVRIQGENLKINYFNANEIELKGRITCTNNEVTRLTKQK